MIFSDQNWAHVVRLQNCLLDPRLDKDLRIGVCEYIGKQEKDKLGESGDFTAEAVLVISLAELPKGYKNFFALGENKEEKLKVKEHVRTQIKSLVDTIKNNVNSAITKNVEFSVNDLPLEIQKFAINYYQSIVKMWELTTAQLMNSYNMPQDENYRFLKTEYEIRQAQEKLLPAYERLPADLVFETATHPLGNSENVQITTSLGRKQEDRCGFIQDINLHPSWTEQNKIPELLAYTAQKLAVKVYEEVPVFDYIDETSGPQSNDENNCSAAGSTLTFLYIHNEVGFVYNVGDSTTLNLKIDKSTRDTQVKLATWSHNPGQKNEIEKFEQARVEQEGGKIINTNRVQHSLGYALAVSRSVGDRAASGMSDIGDITILDAKEDCKTESVFVLGSDGVFDFLKFDTMKKLARYIKADSIAEAFCKEAACIQKNKDDLSAISFNSTNNLFAFIADGHGKACIAEYIQKNLLTLFKNLAEAPAPGSEQEVKLQVKTICESIEPSPKRIKSEVGSSSFFTDSAEKNLAFPKRYSKDVMLQFLNSLPNFYSQLNSKEVKSELERNSSLTCIIAKAEEGSEGTYAIYYLIHQQLLSMVFYLPSEFPMSYNEFKSVPYLDNVMCNDDQLKKFLEDTQASLTALKQSMASTNMQF